MLAALAATAIMAPTYRDRFPLPDATFGAGWGVNIHHAKIEEANEIPQIARAGFKWVRVPFHWSTIEGWKGKYSFRHFDGLVDQLDRQHMRAIAILCYGNDQYGDGSPRTPAQRRAFAQYTVETIKHYRGKGVVWELWNEPNHKQFWMPQPNVDEYMALAREVRSALDGVAPDEWLVGPSTSGLDWDYLQDCFDRGALDIFDAVTVHPYRQENPETVITDYEKLRRMIEARKPSGKKIPIVNSEWGYSEEFQNMTKERQGFVASRMYLSSLVAGVNLHIHFDWKNDPSNGKKNERTFGVVDENLNSRPANDEIGRAVRELGGYKYVGRLPTGGHIFGLVFEKSGAFKIAAWSTTDQGTLRVSDQTIAVSQKPRYVVAQTEWISPYFPTGSKVQKIRRWDDWPPPRRGPLKKR